MSNSAIKSVSAAFVAALASVDSTGHAVTTVCNAARAAFKGETIDDDDMKGIVTNIADARGWKGVTRKVRTSECRAVLETYTLLPEATKKLNAATFTYHDALKLARCIRNAKGNISKAIAAFKRKAASSGEKAKADPKARATKWLNKMYENATAARKQVIREAMELLGLKLKAAE
jgi:hypothetical protein